MQPTVTVYRMPRRYQHCFPPLVLMVGEEIISKIRWMATSPPHERSQWQSSVLGNFNY